MPKPSHKEKILSEGLRVLHQFGYAATSVRDIVKAAGVPQGSFSNHFPTKESFGLEVLNRYYDYGQKLARQTLRNDALDPLTRLRVWIDGSLSAINQNNEWNGCMLGNFVTERSTGTENIQQRVTDIFNEIQDDLTYCLQAAVNAGELSAETNCRQLAGFIHDSLEGSILRSKAIRSSAPTDDFQRMLFSSILPGSASKA